MLAVFDLDGVIADTHDAVRAAYHEVGVDMPDDAWGKPWVDWLVDLVGGDRTKAESLHSMKTVEYRRMIRMGRVIELPAAAVVRELGGRAIVVTSSARSTAGILLDVLGIGKDRLHGAYMTLERRADVLKYYVSANGANLVYVDDLESNCMFIARNAGCRCHHVTPETTADEVRSWTR